MSKQIKKTGKRTQRSGKSSRGQSPKNTGRLPAVVAQAECSIADKSSEALVPVILKENKDGDLIPVFGFAAEMENQRKTTAKSTKTKNCPQLKIDTEFRDFLGALKPGELEKLEKDILENGLREPLLIWKETGILVDGHHRYDICKKHGRGYRIQKMSFRDRGAVRLWMWDNQVGRRNISEFERIETVLKLKGAVVARSKQNQRAGGGAVRQKVDKPLRTDEILGKMAGVSRQTIRDADFILEKYAEGLVSEDTINALRKGTVTPGNVCKQLKASLAAMPSGKTSTPTVPTRATPTPKTKTKPLRDFIKQAKSFLQPFEKSVVEEFPQIEDRVQFYDYINDWATKNKAKLLQKGRKQPPQ